MHAIDCINTLLPPWKARVVVQEKMTRPRLVFMVASFYCSFPLWPSSFPALAYFPIPAHILLKINKSATSFFTLQQWKCKFYSDQFWPKRSSHKTCGSDEEVSLTSRRVQQWLKRKDGVVRTELAELYKWLQLEYSKATRVAEHFIDRGSNWATWVAVKGLPHVSSLQWYAAL